MYFGNIFCDPKNFASTPTQITCQTDSAERQLQNQNVYVGVSGAGIFQCPNSASCRFSFKNSATPLLKRVVPASAAAGSLLSFYGTHRISYLGELRDLGQVKALYIGSSICNRIDFNDDDISANRDEYISCNQGRLQEANEYLASEWLDPGFSRSAYSSFLPNLRTGAGYQFRWLPLITEVSTNSGTAQGQILTIKGSGFSPNPLNMTISAGGSMCSILSASLDQLECLVAETPAGGLLGALPASAGLAGPQLGKFVAGTGLQLTVYPYEGYSTIQALKDKIADGTLQPTSEGTVNQLGETVPTEEPVAHFTRGYFLAENSGEYKFWQTCDDICEFSLATLPNSADPSLLQKVAESTYYMGTHNPHVLEDYYDRTSIKGTATLEAGKYYYLEIYHINGRGTGWYNLEMQAPNTNEAVKQRITEIQKVEIKAPFDPEIVSYSVFGGDMAGEYELYAIEIDPKTLKTAYNVSTMVSASATADQFKSAL